MSNSTNKTRRKVLIGLTASVGAAGLPFAATPFIAAWNPSEKAKASGSPVKVDVSKIEIGQKIQVAWRKQPVFIIRHDPSALVNLTSVEKKLADPKSLKIDEPYRDMYPTRSKSKDFSILPGEALII